MLQTIVLDPITELMKSYTVKGEDILITKFIDDTFTQLQNKLSCSLCNVYCSHHHPLTEQRKCNVVNRGTYLFLNSYSTRSPNHRINRLGYLTIFFLNGHETHNLQLSSQNRLPLDNQPTNFINTAIKVDGNMHIQFDCTVSFVV